MFFVYVVLALKLVLAALVVGLLVFLYRFLIEPFWDPLFRIAGPSSPGFLGSHLDALLSPYSSPRLHELWVNAYGRSIHCRGVGAWDERLLTLDPGSVAYILKNSTTYEKPWQSRALINSLIGCGMLSAEGLVHKRQRRVATPAFSIQNLRNIIPLVFKKGTALKDKWVEMIAAAPAEELKERNGGIVLDVCHWVSRATFDVIGVAGFDYQFNAIQNESNELFNAYKEMFEVSMTQTSAADTLRQVYFPWWYKLFPSRTTSTVTRCREVIYRVAGRLVQEKKRVIEEGEKSGKPYQGRDLLTLLLKSNMAVDLPDDQRISDDDILNNVNTFMFAGSDTSSLTVTWALYLLAEKPEIQDRLRTELLAAFPGRTLDISSLTEEDIQSMYAVIAELPLLDNIVKECVRVIPPVHSSIRVATKDDEIPTTFPVKLADGTWDTKRSVTIRKGSFIHVAVEGFNLDKEFWGEDAWEFNPDRWDNLPEAAKNLPGLFSNTLTFSAGPRSCIGVRFSMIEIKAFLYVLFTHFTFKLTEKKIAKNNVVLTRPYVRGQYDKGSQLPMIVTPYVPDSTSTS